MYTVTDLFLAGSDSSILSHGSFDVVRKTKEYRNVWKLSLLREKLMCDIRFQYKIFVVFYGFVYETV